ncbi:hypothetical protein JHK82_035098 [Glycine max]|nr:hypothetical protein JHK87_035032 [Glycine soja]KAG4969404.1 hypothetical protein JHK85_035825 [Glycine max]KAG4975745.1 hypothetical protein JHK86_035219 [Glycine max]KAG5111829.1 hypothetical protein JHK82_035098 [Glycine max]KAG5129101.1 hypothetical protein JHK84_035498 [Glycine max]
MGYFFWYDRVKGFGPRKKKFLKNKMGEILQQTFVCFREGKREDLPKTMCKCKAKMKVHIEINLILWHISDF